MTYDHQGSFISLVDHQGIALLSQRWGPWGQRLTIGDDDIVETASNKSLLMRGFPQRLGFSIGINSVAANLLLLGDTRLYNSSTKRFYNSDDRTTGNIRGENRFSYAYNNPLHYIDPNGHEPQPNDYNNDYLPPITEKDKPAVTFRGDRFNIKSTTRHEARREARSYINDAFRRGLNPGRQTTGISHEELRAHYEDMEAPGHPALTSTTPGFGGKTEAAAMVTYTWAGAHGLGMETLDSEPAEPSKELALVVWALDPRGIPTYNLSETRNTWDQETYKNYKVPVMFKINQTWVSDDVPEAELTLDGEIPGTNIINATLTLIESSAFIARALKARQEATTSHFANGTTHYPAMRYQSQHPNRYLSAYFYWVLQQSNHSRTFINPNYRRPTTN